MSDVLRIIDANANRAREALRVIEEAARFLLDERDLTEKCKQLRHDLRAALLALPDLALHRNTAGDVGTDIAIQSEQQRGSAAAVVQAAGARLSEALRVIEEYSKLLDPALSAQIEQLRYRGYTLHSDIAARLPVGARQWQVCLLLTESLCTQHDWQHVALAAIDAGVDCVQLREKSLDDRAMLQRAKQLREMTAGRCDLILNDRPDIALRCQADGVHLGQNDLPVGDVRALAGQRLLIGVSTHDLREAEQAVRAGADYCGVGAMFASHIKPGRAPSGPEYLQMFLDRWPQVPHLAIGGITPANVAALINIGCRGVAVSSAICSAANPGEVARQLREARSAHAIDTQPDRAAAIKSKPI